MANRRYEKRLALNFCHFHARILPRPQKRQKPTIGFQARFFGEGSRTRKFLHDKDLRGEKSRKTEKGLAKVSFFSLETPVFLPKRPKKGPFLLSVRFSGAGQAVFGLDGEELALISGSKLFRAKIEHPLPDPAKRGQNWTFEGLVHFSLRNRGVASLSQFIFHPSFPSLVAIKPLKNAQKPTKARRRDFCGEEFCLTGAGQNSSLVMSGCAVGQRERAGLAPSPPPTRSVLLQV